MVKIRDKIKFINTKDIKEYSNNNKSHPKHQIDLLIKNIKKFGFTTPLLINSKSKVIIAGHGRLMAARELDLKKLPYLDVSDLSLKEQKALRIADNKITELADWNFDSINKEIEEIGDLNLTELTGFDFTEVENENYEPILNPNIDNFDVNEEDIGKTQDSLNDLGDSEKQHSTIRCPHCTKEFEIDL